MIAPRRYRIEVLRFCKIGDVQTLERNYSRFTNRMGRGLVYVYILQCYIHTYPLINTNKENEGDYKSPSLRVCGKPFIGIRK